MGSKTQTSTSSNNSTTTPTNLSALQSIFDKVQGAASTPFTPYSGELTAGVNGQQQTGINSINSAAGTASPFYNAAATYAGQAGAPITAAQIQDRSNPFQQQVIDSTMANINETNGQQQQQVKGNAALAGALGGDRQAVAQAELTRQQNLTNNATLAGLNSANYTQALSAAQADRTAAGNAASLFGNLGTGAQTAALQGAGAQINAGTLQQQTQQAGDTANYQQYLQAQGFPYAQAQFLSQYGTPAALSQGSTTSSNGTQTTPGPSILGQIAGLGTAALGFATGNPFAAASSVSSLAGGSSPSTGATFGGYAPGNTSGYGSYGGISYPAKADGGAVSSPFGPSGFIPAGSPPIVPAHQGAAPVQSIGRPQQDTSFAGPIISALNGMKKSRSDSYADGGFIDAIQSIHRSIKQSRSGGSPFHFADGGSTFDDRFSAAFPMQTIAPPEPASAPVAPEEPFRLAGPAAMDAWRNSVGNPAEAADVPTPGQPINPMRNPSLPPQITNPDSTPDDAPDNVMAFDRASRSRGAQSNVYAPIGMDQSQGATTNPLQNLSPQETSTSPFGFSDKQRQALIAAGFGMLASKSPFALSAIGEGGLKGLASYSEANQAEREAADKRISQVQNQRRIDLEGARLAQSSAQYLRSQTETERSNRASEEKEYAKKPLVRDDPNTGERSFLSFDPKTGGLAEANVPKSSSAAPEQFTSTAAPVQERRKAPQASPEARDEGFYEYMQGKRPPGYADIVRGVADYEIDPNKEASLQKGARDRLYRDVKQYDPTYDQTHFAEKSGVIQNFSRGPASQAVNSLNVSVAHLGTLSELGDALKNGNYPAINKIANAIAVQTGKPAPTNFDAAKEIVGDEVVKAVVGGVSSQADREAIKHLIMAQQSPEQLNGVIKTFISLLGGQLDGQRQRYQAGTGLNNFDQKYLAPATQEALKRTSDGKIDPAVSRLVFPSGIPKEMTSQPSTDSAPTTKTVGGKTYVRRGGQWFEQ